MIIWYAIACILLLDLVVMAVRRHVDARRRHGVRHERHMVEIGKERDMFYVPGDSTSDDDDEL